MGRKPLLRCGMAIVVVLLTLRGFAPAQTSTPPPTPAPTPPQVERLKVRVLNYGGILALLGPEKMMHTLPTEESQGVWRMSRHGP